MNKAVALAVVIALAPSVVLGQATQQDYHNDGKAFGTSLNTGAAQAAVNSGSVGLVPNYAGSTRPESQYQNGVMTDAAISAARDTSTPQGNAASLIQGSFATRPQIPVSKTDTWLVNGQNAIANPQSVAPNNSLTGQYADCQTVGGTTQSTADLHTCDTYYTETNNSCSIGTVVDVQNNWQYICTQSRNTYTESCTRQLSVTFDPVQGIVQQWTSSC